MKYFKIILVFLFLFALNLSSKELYFPPVIGNEWETTSPEELGWCTENIQELYDTLQTKNTKAFLVLKDGKIVLEKYFGTFTQDSSWYWASAGKCLTSFTVGMVKSEGKINLEDKTSKYLGVGWTSLTKEQEDKITVWNQLTMTTGLDDKVNDPYCTDKSCLEYKADAGTRWAYHNGPYTLLDEVIENATGQNLNNYISQNLRTKTGISGLFVKVEYNNVFFSKPRSMARFGLLMLNKGDWDGNVILEDKEFYNNSITSSQDINQSYGYLWWLNGKESYMAPLSQIVFKGALAPNGPKDMYSALGKNGQILNIVPSQNLIVVRMGETPVVNEQVSLQLNNEIWQVLNKVICNQTSVGSTTQNQIRINDNRETLEITNLYYPEFDNQVKIYNLMGIELFNQNFNDKITINKSIFADKVLIIQTISNGNSQTTKLIIE